MTVLNELNLRCVADNCLNEETTQWSIEIRNDEYYAVIRIVQPLYNVIGVRNCLMHLINQFMKLKGYFFAFQRGRITAFEILRYIELMESKNYYYRSYCLYSLRLSCYKCILECSRSIIALDTVLSVTTVTIFLTISFWLSYSIQFQPTSRFLQQVLPLDFKA